MNGFSVIMPTYNQSGFIRRAVLSLFQQTCCDWELMIINDGSTDNTESFLLDFLQDKRITYIKNELNQGMGYAINQGIDAAKYNYIAYLPSDDFYYPDHLESLYQKFNQSADIVLAFTGVRYENKDSFSNIADMETTGIRQMNCLQLVQTAHKKTKDRWVERSEWVSDNLFNMFWVKLADKGIFAATKQITCYWTSHPLQRHRIISEDYGGGLNYYRCHYQVKAPVKMWVSDTKFIDEEEVYATFRRKIPKSKKGLKILLVGELAYNPERIYALEEHGQTLYGLWTTKPGFSFATVGPLPFGNVTDIPYENWKERVKQIKPDIIYAMLNLDAIPLAYEVLKNVIDIPFVWHFKEGPHISIRFGHWEKLINLYALADGKIYLNHETKNWYEQFIPQSASSFILDGDLPKADYFTDNFSSKLSEFDGAVHTVIPGRIVGIDENDMKIMAEQNIHLHIYTENYHTSREYLHNKLLKVAPLHFHLHPHCTPVNWVKEFSQYDAGWLHCFESVNNGNLMRAAWNDLNVPARISTLAAAGLPMILRDNTGHIVTTQSQVKDFDIGIFFNEIGELGRVFDDKMRMEKLKNNVLEHRKQFCFDYHVSELIDFFKDVIRQYKLDHK
jgi:glycosyltransferase involved in cell wall biosynthesis